MTEIPHEGDYFYSATSGTAIYWIITTQPHNCKVAISANSTCSNAPIPVGSLAVEFHNTSKDPVLWCYKCTKSVFSSKTLFEPPSELMAIAKAKKVKKSSDVLTITSFSYKKGAPSRDDCYIIDVRKTVRNPWKFPELRSLDGRSEEIKNFIRRCPKSMAIVGMVVDALESCYSVAIGCAHGKHRSVAIAELVAEEYQKKFSGISVKVIHRDLE